MTENRIRPIVMPKWGLSMSQGKVTGWLVKPGAKVKIGDELLEVETEKIASVVEAGDQGTLRRIIGEPQTVYPVKALLGVLADDDVSDSEIDAYVASYVMPAAEEEEEAEPQYHLVDLPSGRVRYAKRGEGDAAIVLIHGLGGDLDNWLFNIDALAAEANVYALDLPGHGQSSKNIADPTLHGLAQALIAFMDEVGIDHAHLVGHSLGGAIATSVALDRPERVTALTLIAPAGLGPEIAGEFVEGFISETRARKLRPVLEMLVADPGLVTADMVEEVLKFKRLDGAIAGLRTVADANFSGGQQRVSLRERLREIDLPVQVLWGEADRVLPAAHADGLPESIAVVRVSGAGHIVHMERAAEVNEAIRAHGPAKRES